MIDPKDFIDCLRVGGVEMFAGVPDSLLKPLCAYITDNIPNENNIIAVNEGCAVGLAAGYHLATGKIGCVYMQNSGEGNAVNPLLSLVDSEVYSIPLLLVIGWRGEPGVKDEPQHIKQGKVTLSLLESIGVTYTILDDDWHNQVTKALRIIASTNTVHALIVRKNTFSQYLLKSDNDTDNWDMSREQAIKLIVDCLLADDIVVSTTGMISRELYEYRELKGHDHSHDFLTVGSMGHASQIALGIALQQPNRRVILLDGDGALLMHMGGMATIGQYAPKNMVHIVLNNGAHDSVGGQPTVGQKINIEKIANALGYAYARCVDTTDRLLATMNDILTSDSEGVKLINVLVRKGNRQNLGRPATKPVENKDLFMKNMQK